MDSPDPRKTQSTVGTKLSIYAALWPPGTTFKLMNTCRLQMAVSLECRDAQAASQEKYCGSIFRHCTSSSPCKLVRCLLLNCMRDTCCAIACTLMLGCGVQKRNSVKGKRSQENRSAEKQVSLLRLTLLATPSYLQIPSA